MKNKLFIRIICIVAAALLVLGTIIAAFAEDLQLLELTDTTVVAKVGDTEVLWGDVKGTYDELVSQYGSYYDLTDPIYESLFRAVAVESKVEEILVKKHAESLGLAEISEEDRAAAIAEADAMWEGMIEDYLAQNPAADDTEEAKAAARTAAEEYYKTNYGYDQEFVRNYYVNAIPSTRLYNELTKDVVVTDEEIVAAHNATVEEDKALYENDLEGYCSAIANADFMAYYSYMMTGSYQEPEYPTYRPAGFRTVKHILLKVDETLLSDYNDKQAALEEQAEEAEAEEAEGEEAAEIEEIDLSVEETAEEGTEEATEEAAEEAAEPAEPVTEADVAAAEAAILASVADTVVTINERYAAGESFDDLIKEYSTDSGSTYEICPYSTNYVESFVNAGCAIENKGELSAPVVSTYGVHILQYVDDIPAGPIELSADEIEAKRSTLLEEKKTEAYSTACEAFNATVEVSYVMPTADEVMAMDDARNAAAAEEEEAAEDTVEGTMENTEETPAE